MSHIELILSCDILVVNDPFHLTDVDQLNISLYCILGNSYYFHDLVLFFNFNFFLAVVTVLLCYFSVVLLYLRIILCCCYYHICYFCCFCCCCCCCCVWLTAVILYIWVRSKRTCVLSLIKTALHLGCDGYTLCPGEAE